MEREENGKVL